MYKKYLIENFGNLHLSGLDLLARACELYSEGDRKFTYIYTKVARETGLSYQRVERNIRHYIDKSIKDNAEGKLTSKMHSFANKEVVAAIVYEVKLNEFSF